MRRAIRRSRTSISDRSSMSEQPSGQESDLVDQKVFAIPGSGGDNRDESPTIIRFYTWLTEDMFEFLKDPVAEAFLKSWLVGLDFEPTHFFLDRLSNSRLRVSAL